jgi:hypothetical protein
MQLFIVGSRYSSKHIYLRVYMLMLDHVVLNYSVAVSVLSVMCKQFISAIVYTNFAEKLRSLGRYSSLVD